MTGTKIGNRIVMFSKTGVPENEPIRLVVTGNVPCKVLLTDVANGNWKMTGPQSNTVRAANNLLYFEAQPGEYQLTR